MTTLLYIPGDGIYSDSKHVKVVGNQQKVNYQPKVFYTEDKTAMYGIAGEFLVAKKEHHDEIVKRTLVEYNRSIRVPNPTVNERSLKSLIDGELIMVDNKGHNYVYNSESDCLYVLTDVNYYATGSGQPIAYAVMRIWGDPDKAMEQAIKIDRTSGGDIHHVSILNLVNEVE